MTEEQKRWNVTTWIVFSGIPATETWQLHGSGKSEAAALRDAMQRGALPAGVKTAKLMESS